jgi:hypothetical protein
MEKISYDNSKTLTERVFAEKHYSLASRVTAMQKRKAKHRDHDIF